MKPRRAQRTKTQHQVIAAGSLLLLHACQSDGSGDTPAGSLSQGIDQADAALDAPAAVTRIPQSRLVQTAAPRGQVGSGRRLRQILPRRSAPTTLAAYERPDEVIVKFHEGTRTRLRAGRYDPFAVADTVDRAARRARVGIVETQVSADVAELNTLIAAHPEWIVVPMFNRPEDVLESERITGESRTNSELADLSLYSYIVMPDSSREQTAAIIDQINLLPSVELVEAQLQTRAPGDIAPTTPNFQANQTYLNAAPAGISAYAAWTRAGAGGFGNLWLHDIETGWLTGHEDFPAYNWQRGWNVGELDHGAAVIGITSAPPNGYGVSGIAAYSTVNLYSIIQAIPPWDPAGTINLATSYALPGDVILIEQEAPGPDPGTCPSWYSPGNPGTPCAADCSEWGMLPMEWDQPSFDAIAHATSLGIVVVEPAGNGGQLLDNARYNRAFDLTFRDSQAVMVAAIVGSGNYAPACFTNSGSRPDVSSWGFNVVSLGYGDFAQINGSDSNQFYTRFNGTSSAGAIVAGAALSVNGALAVHGHPMESSLSMIVLFQNTGTPTGVPFTPRVGPQPNIDAALTFRGI